MKKIFYSLLLTAMIAVYTPAKAVLVNIPDANFRARLQTLYPACFVGGQMETTCSGITSTTILNVANTGTGASISSLSGVEHFTNLIKLDCYQLQLITLPALPPNLEELYCFNNRLTSLPSLPSTLKYLNCGGNLLTTLPALPPSLLWLYCSNNNITVLPVLPANLTIFYFANNGTLVFPTLPTTLNRLSCGGNKFTVLPTLPVGLTELDCSNNLLTVLPMLPTNIQYLFCSNNLLTVLPTLPANVSWLYANNNQLTVLPALPTTNLQRLFCASNQLSALPTLPNTLQELSCSSNKLTVLPTLPTSIQLLGCGTNLLTVLPTLPASLQSVGCGSNLLTVLPALPANLYGLVCSNNQLTALPTLPSTLREFACDNNFLDFADLEVLTSRPSSFYVATPQSYQISPATQIQNIGSAFSINGTIGGSLNQYQWYKDNVIISGATNATFSIAGFALTDIGEYKCEVKSSFVGAGTTTGVIIIGKVNVTTCAAITFANKNAIDALVNTPYSVSAQLTVAGAAYSIAPALPIGLSINTNTGIISGIATALTPSTSYTVTATIGTCSLVQNYTFGVVCGVINFATLANGTVGLAYTQTLTQMGLTGALTWSIITGTLPAGLSINVATGIISGTPTTSGTSNITIGVTNGGSCLPKRTYEIIINTDPTTSIDNALSNQIKVSPNPFNANFSIDFGSIDMNKSLLRVYDAQGKTVFSSENNTNLMTISLEKFASGIYLLEAQTGKTRIMKRLVKQ